MNTDVTVNKIEGFIFDLDGVVTDTQELHARAWEMMFNEFLRARRGKHSDGDERLDDFSSSDYTNFLDGKPRSAGIRSFLESRGITLPEDEVSRLSRIKNDHFLELVDSEGARLIHDTVAFIQDLRKAHIPTALVSSSRNARRILGKSGLSDYFDTVVTPNEAEKIDLRGKPYPDYFLEASKQIRKSPEKCVVVEDSLAGVEAALAGGFGEVVGLDYHGDEKKLALLKEHGAHEAVSSLWNMNSVREILPLPNVLEEFDGIFPSHSKLDYFLFLDFDGTLSPIVDDPAEAEVLEELPAIIQKCTEYFRVCIITGRDTPVIKAKLHLSNVIYAACHGFEITSFPNFTYQVEEARAAVPLLDEAEKKFRDDFEGVEGFVLERKSFGVALHYRMIASERKVEELKEKVLDYVSTVPGLKLHEGEDVLEVLPQVHWDKGMAMLKIYEVTGLQQKDLPPLYIGDGQTDEDAFREMESWGIPVLASVEQRPTRARYHLRGPTEVKEFLTKLLERKSENTYV